MTKHISLLAILLLFIFQNSFSQIHGSERTQFIESALVKIYNCDSTVTDEIIQKLSSEDPATCFLTALALRWKNFPLEHNSFEYDEMKNQLNSCFETASSTVGYNMNEIQFIKTVSKALTVLYELESGEITLKKAKQAYKLIKDGDSMIEDYNEFKLTSGIYNYLRDKFPERYLLGFVVDNFASILFGFKKGDQEKGLNQLKEASKDTNFSKFEAALYLAHINLRYESNYHDAITHLQELVIFFPKNNFFRVLLAESYYWNGQLDSMKSQIHLIDQEKNPFYKMSTLFFMGVHAEFIIKDLSKAKFLYEKSNEIGLSIQNEESDIYQTLSLRGLTRIAKFENRPFNQILKTAKKVAPYNSLKVDPDWIQNQ